MEKSSEEKDLDFIQYRGNCYLAIRIVVAMALRCLFLQARYSCERDATAVPQAWERLGTACNTGTEDHKTIYVLHISASQSVRGEVAARHALFGQKRLYLPEGGIWRYTTQKRVYQRSRCQKSNRNRLKVARL